MSLDAESDAQSFTIPNVSPSVNACYRASGRRVYKSKRLREYEQEMLEYFETHDHRLMTGRLKLEVSVFFRTNRKRDLDNILKSLIDSLEGRLFENDEQIYELVVRKEIGCLADETRIIISSSACQ